MKSTPHSTMGKFPADPNAPKRPQTAYFRFAADYRPTFMKQNPELASQVAEIGRAIGAAWGDLDTAQKEKYQGAANKDFAKYKAKMDAYKKTAKFAKYQAEKKEFNKEQKKRNGKKVLKKMLKNEPKRPMTAYFLFMNEKREEWEGEDMAFTEVGKKAAGLWKEMSDANKAKYNKKAAGLWKEMS